MTEINVIKGQCALIEWVDSSILGGWQYSDNLEATPKHIMCVGFVCAMSAEALTLTVGQSDSGGVIAPLTIPYCCITKCRAIDLR